MKRWAYLMIAIGAALWGLIGLFVHNLYYYGFNPIQVVAIRVITAGFILLLYVLITNKSAFKIKLLDCKYFIGTGILSIVFFNWCYFTAIEEVSLSIAAVLLYTGPAFVTILSRFVFHEQLTKRKVLALSITLIGCSLIVGLLPTMRASVSWYGLIVGLGSGLGYALYSIFGKLASYKYSSLTITAYTFLFASAVMLPTSGLWEVRELFFHRDVLFYGIGLGLIPTVLAYMLYTVGLSQIESSRASITTTIEPVVAALIGIIIFGDQLTGWQTLGIAFILLAVVLVQETRNKTKNTLDTTKNINIS